MLRVVVVTAIALVGISTGAQATGWYAGFGTAWSAPGDVAFGVSGPTSSAAGELSLNHNAAFDVTAGYELPVPVRLEGELRFAAFSSEALRPGNGGAAVPLRGRVDMDSLFANAFYDIPLTDIFGLSVGGGIGAARFSPDMMDSFGDHLRSAQTGFSWQGIGGLRAKLTDQLELQADYRHQTIDSTEHSFAPAEGQSTRLSLGNKPVQSVMLSIRWFFNPLH